MSTYRLLERLPTPEEHRALFEAVGWHPYAPQAAAAALANSLAGAVVLEGDTVLGMGRVIGDGGKFFYIQDVAVRPEYQDQGVGRLIMDTLLAYIRRVAPHEPFVGLFATDVALNFYSHYGFAAQPFGLTGMGTILPVDNTGSGDNPR